MASSSGTSGAQNSHSKAIQMEQGLAQHNPWLSDPATFHENVSINKSDLLLPAVVPKFEDGCLTMPNEAYMPVERTWEYCLLGFYDGRFPAKKQHIMLFLDGHDVVSCLFT